MPDLSCGSTKAEGGVQGPQIIIPAYSPISDNNQNKHHPCCQQLSSHSVKMIPHKLQNALNNCQLRLTAVIATPGARGAGLHP